MKAIVYENYGSPDVLELREIENPTPNDDEILIKVHAASVNAIDHHFLLGTPFLVRIVAGGLLNPKRKVLGVDVAGQVEDVGGNVKRFQSGQKVLINSTSDAVGTFAVQIAKSYETEVTGVCSTSNFDMVRSIGADQVIDYTQEDFAQNEGHYDNDVRYREEA